MNLLGPTSISAIYTAEGKKRLKKSHLVDILLINHYLLLLLLLLSQQHGKGLTEWVDNIKWLLSRVHSK